MLVIPSEDCPPPPRRTMACHTPNTLRKAHAPLLLLRSFPLEASVAHAQPDNRRSRKATTCSTAANVRELGGAGAGCKRCGLRVCLVMDLVLALAVVMELR